MAKTLAKNYAIVHAEYVFMCYCTVHCSTAYCPRMKSDTKVVTHFQFGSLLISVSYTHLRAHET